IVSETLKSLVLERRDHLSSAFPLRFEPGSHGQCLFGAKGAIKAGRIELSGGGPPSGEEFLARARSLFPSDRVAFQCRKMSVAHFFGRTWRRALCRRWTYAGPEAADGLSRAASLSR